MRAGDTIYALSTASGKAGVAVIRVSGPAAALATNSIAGRIPPARQATLATFTSPADAAVLDRGLVLYFPAPASFTGEDVAEFHVHGGRAVVSGMLEALSALEGCRAAEPGEFVRRAFEAGKLDLTRTEALANLLDAETAAQRQQALNNLQGGLGAKADAWRTRLIHAQALAEADIDFSDEGDVPTGLVTQAQDLARSLSHEITEALAAPGGERLRQGAVIMIAGAPNAGKSSFLNAVAQRDVAIVTEHAGTTRDMLEVQIDLGGYPATLIDTAGIRETTDPVEAEAIARGQRRLQAADIVLWLSDSGFDSAPFTPYGLKTWKIHTKCDLREAPLGVGHSISARTGAGLAGLLEALAAWLKLEFEPAVDALIVRSRHREALQEALSALRIIAARREPELIAEELRLAARALGRISGRVDVEDVLDVLFGAFCIGK